MALCYERQLNFATTDHLCQCKVKSSGKYIALHQVNWHWEQLLDCSLRFYALMANQSSTVPLDLLLCD